MNIAWGEAVGGLSAFNPSDESAVGLVGGGRAFDVCEAFSRGDTRGFKDTEAGLKLVKIRAHPLCMGQKLVVDWTIVGAGFQGGSP